MSTDKSPALVVLYDGVCNLCNKSVSFISRHDKRKRFRYKSLQSETGQALLLKHGINTKVISSIVFIENERAYTKSTAALRISKYLTGLYPLLFLFIIVPPFIRNSMYNFVAKKRYAWFGKTKQKESESC